MSKSDKLMPPPGMSKSIVMAADERRSASVLIVDALVPDRMSLRQTLISLGFQSFSDASDHISGLAKLGERKITHLLFQASETNMKASDFLMKAYEYDENIIALPTSYDPTIDDVFELLVLGARGYLVKPFNTDALDSAMNWATHGAAMSESILFAKDRNEALTSLVMGNLDRLSHTMRQAREFETAKREIPLARAQFTRSIEMALSFAKGGPEAIAEAFVEFAIERSQGPASALGRFRQRIQKRKSQMAEQIAKRNLLNEVEESLNEVKAENEAAEKQASEAK